ncbi:unnamed protein product [Discula destructiva]
MFVCRACARRASTNPLRRLHTAENRLVAPARTFATTSIPRRPFTPASEPHNLSSDWGQLEAVAAKEKPDDHGVSQSERAIAQQKALEKMKRATRIELQHTTDPYHIAENVAKKLADDEFDKALMLTREASKDKQVVVSWNYLIAHEFKRQRLRAAINLYNEMKKRAQLPNAQTYTTIFRGCAGSKHPKLAVAESLRIYNVMLASNRLKPNQIHLNALLNTCARAEDIESMFIALRTANGTRSPDNLTYTIILNALRCQRENAIDFNNDTKAQSAEAKESRAKTISRSKLVWDEVITRWKNGEIPMDEELMCAMGRVLLLGGAAETDSILGVVGEVLDITKLRDGEPGLIDSSPGNTAAAKTPEKPRRIERAEQFDESDRGDDFASSRPKQATITAPLPRSHAPAPSGPLVLHKMAGNNTLSLVMRALALARRTKLAARYWDYLIHAHDIVPDRRNYRDYIDCLSTGAASSKAARLLVSMPATIADGNLYRRGLLLCHFDAFNDSAFENATLIHSAMLRKLRVPDARCMKLYLQVAMSSYRQFTDKEKYPAERDGLKAHAQQILTALDQVFGPLKLATNDLAYSDAALARTPQEAWTRTWPQRQEILEVAQKFIAASDKILSQNLIEKRDENFRVTVTRRSVLHHFIDRLAAQNRQHSGLGAWTRRGADVDEEAGFSA